MELITALAEAQKCQEATLIEMKKKLEENQLKLDRIIEERQLIANELEHCKEVIKDLEIERENLKKELDDLLMNSQNEIGELKMIIDANESEWKLLLSERKVEIESVEKKLFDTELELAKSVRKIDLYCKKEAAVGREFKKLKSMECVTKEENNKLKITNINLEKSLNELKLDLLKVTNNNDRLIDEVKWTKKHMETFKELWGNVKEQNVTLEKKNEQYILNAGKNNLLEQEMKEFKMNLIDITKNNRTIIDTVNDIKQTLQKDLINVSIQTDMSGKDLNQYEHLDREATLMVVGLREELVTSKDELIRARRDNDELKTYISDIRRQVEISEEEQRVYRLEQTVNSLTNIINRKEEPSISYNSNNNMYSNNKNSSDIMIALEDVKKDLALLKTRSWNRVIRAEVEVPTRDRGEFTSSPRRNIPDGVRAVKFTGRLPFEK